MKTISVLIRDLKSFSVLSLFVIAFWFLVLLSTPPFAHAAILCNKLSPSTSIPIGFGASYNLFSTAKEYLVSGICSGSTATVTLGNSAPLTYVYNKGYYWTGTSWTPYTLSCSSGQTVSGAWCVGSGTASIPLSTNPTNVIGYTCQWNGAKWNCGCSDSTCPQPPKWQLQKIAVSTIEGTCTPSITNPSPRPETPRDRVRIVNNTVVTDTGAPLRGAHMNSNQPRDLAWLRNMRDTYGLNTMRLDTRITTRPTNADYLDSTAYLKPDLEAVFKSVDTAVNLTEQAGMYLILTNFTSCCGEYHTDLNKIFWDKAAARYKDRKHVLYEVQNEPVAWTPEKYDAAAIAFEEEMYVYIRQRAPLTHIILWTPAHGTKSTLLGKIRQATSINYNNASVGIHMYHFETEDPTWANTRALRNAYPIIDTEYSHEPNNKTGIANAKRLWEFLEGDKISWIMLDLTPTPSGGFGNYGAGVSFPCEWDFLWPAPAE